MATTKIELIGLTDLSQALEPQMNNIKSVVRTYGSYVQQEAIKRVPKRTHFLERSIEVRSPDNGLTAVVIAKAEYAAYVEFGTRYMEAQPYMEPSLMMHAEGFKDALKGAMLKGK